VECDAVLLPTSVAARSQAWVCGACLLGLWVRIPAAEWISVSCVVCCQVDVSATGWSLVQRSPTECGVSECDCESSIMRRPWPIRGCRGMKERRCVIGRAVSGVLTDLGIFVFTMRHSKTTA
jgi:hypothetical protein